MQAIAAAKIIRVSPSSRQYPTIQSGINDAVDGDTVEVARGIYTGEDNRNLDFSAGLLPVGGVPQTRAITLRSTINPAFPDWDIIANTIIDCGGKPDHVIGADNGAANRAFWFHRGEGPNTVVMGFTIRNGYTRGHKGADGTPDLPLGPMDWTPPMHNGQHWPFDTEWGDPELPPIADYGSDAPFMARGYGGAILCGIDARNLPDDRNACSPTIKYCIIEDCTVAGGEGGRGADGKDSPQGGWQWYAAEAYVEPFTPGCMPIDLTVSPELICDPEAEPNDEPQEREPFTSENGQWGGRGGNGHGMGLGAAIACRNASSPIITDCIFRNNIARGGIGGDGGNGGNPYTEDFGLTWDGDEASGGDAGWGWGDGTGGVIYSEGGGGPIVTNCTFEGSAATIGLGGEGGARSQGNDADPPTFEGFNGIAVPDGYISGGVAYYKAGTNASFTNCTFTNNRAYEISYWYQIYAAIGLPGYGGLPAVRSTVGGALYFYGNNNVNLNNCDFIDNLGGAIYFGDDCNVIIHNSYDPSRACLFSGNSDPNDGGDLETDTHIDFGAGGALYIGSRCTVDLRNCTFGGNSAANDGGAVKCKSDATLTDCSFGNNVAGRFGGGMDVYGGVPLTLDFNSCSFVSNEARYGGGISAELADINFTNCYVGNNKALEGGGMDLVSADVEIIGGDITGNRATAYNGGGVNCQYTDLLIRDSLVRNNIADGIWASGGGISLDGRGSHQVQNCLFASNSAADYGGAIHCYSATPEIENCTFAANVAGTYGGGIFANWDSLPQISDSIITNCNNHAIHEEDPSGDALVEYSLFYNNIHGDYYDSGTQLTYTGPSEIGNIPGGSNNIYGDPLFVSGPLGMFYLSQTAAGQFSDSPAVDAGSVLAASVGLDASTTRTDNVGDAGVVDLGYHYATLISTSLFRLTVSVTGGMGTVEVTSPAPVLYDAVSDAYWYYGGTVVTVTATPAAGWRVEAWGGTDDDSSTETTNTVFMNADKNVSVSFDMPRTITVGDVGYPTIESAVRDARPGDNVLVPPGVWYGPTILLNKPITLRAMDPNDPSATILDGTDYVERRINFGQNADSRCVLEGFTIQNCGWQPGLMIDPVDCPGENGVDGPGVEGGAIRIADGASPTIKNCIIRDNLMRGGDASGGCGADETHNAGRGGWGGWARGGGVYCGKGSEPTFINCQIIDNHAGGGNGGDGGDDADPGGMPNYGGNWSTLSMAIGDPCEPLLPPYPDIHPEDLSWELLPGVDLWTVWTDYRGPPYMGDYRWYSAYGGGVFCDTDSAVTFINCTINGNRTSGGMSGEGGVWVAGDNDMEPEISYQLPSYGAGIYCSADSNVMFIGCTITDNTAVRPDEDRDAYFNPQPGADDYLRAYYHLDPYTGHGGGVCAEGTAMVTFVDCFVGRNKASLGGGIYYRDSNARVVDSSFESNIAYRGGALLGIDGPATVIGCDFTNNESFGMVTDPCGEDNDPNEYDPNRNYYLPGDGGGMYADRMTGQVIDCTFIGNEAGASGGGIFFSGETDDELTNCLLAGNMAGRNGGGVSASLLTQLQVSNCTITDNLVSGGFFANKAGGGVYCSDGGNTFIIDSILWDNSADFGNEIAIGTNISSGAVSVSYSDVQGGALGVWVDPGCVLNWDDANNLHGTSADAPVFVFGDLGNFGDSGGFFLSQPAADSNQIQLSPCVDAGSDAAHSLDMYRHTTRTDGVLDGLDPSDYPDAQVDIGYHYVLRSDLVGDFDYDGDVDAADLYRFNLHWLNVGCEFPDWCHGKDLNRDGVVNLEDYALFAQNFLEFDEMPPTPDPMTWAVPPYSTSQTDITMLATTARDNSGSEVEYQFERYYFASGDVYRIWDWNPSETHVDSGLITGQKYGYRVRARDAAHNMTDWSYIGYAVAGELVDRTPPTPDPMTWQTEPAASETSATMRATTATDPSGGVQYYFEETSNLPGGDDSDWQNESTYTDTGLMTGVAYSYRVKARDGSVWRNETGWSSTVTVIPEEGVEEDVNSPWPVMWDPNAINNGQPYETGSGFNAWAHMTAAVATDPEGAGVQYYFECVQYPGIFPNGYSSGWTDLPIWDVPVGRTNQGLMFRFRVRDLSPNLNESDWSTTLPAYPFPY